MQGIHFLFSSHSLRDLMVVDRYHAVLYQRVSASF